MDNMEDKGDIFRHISQILRSKIDKTNVLYSSDRHTKNCTTIDCSQEYDHILSIELFQNALTVLSDKYLKQITLHDILSLRTIINRQTNIAFINKCVNNDKRKFKKDNITCYIINDIL